MKKELAYQVGLFTPATNDYPYDDVTLVNDDGGIFDAETPEEAVTKFTGHPTIRREAQLKYQGLILYVYIDTVTGKQYVAPRFYAGVL